MSERSELAILVETETRLDGAIAAARQAADDAREAARTRARVVAGRLETEIALERARIASAIAAETAERERALEGRVRRALVRYEGLRDGELTALARTLARRLLAIAEDDA